MKMARVTCQINNRSDAVALAKACFWGPCCQSPGVVRQPHSNPMVEKCSEGGEVFWGAAVTGMISIVFK